MLLTSKDIVLALSQQDDKGINILTHIINSNPSESKEKLQLLEYTLIVCRKWDILDNLLIMKDKTGRTLFDIASENNQSEILAILERYDQKPFEFF